ncbi:sensor histidine kinase [Clostridium septicum]|uniref:histidine kinase n=1 Tax=Clostridium septicum TaxID=1504 RepID=A0ABY5B4J3_CLOSE|nr:PAS domain-containing sensor histidine kinase [Clostridium septicum]QAS60494.1 PAS domain-containing protein [Clostridium septicum]UEC20248.1 PAS domain-containing sensor histidine kinase [Clostridium septicum]USS01699.1 PAS domain-containing sensor histidine kinase [Clostridium septicum]WLF70271.1 PAS domain-containing sensor histidine kinase [Clostridium septicum]
MCGNKLFNNEESESFINLLDDYILIINRKGEILYSNKSILKRVGYSIKDTYGKNILKKINRLEKKISLELYSKNNEKINFIGYILEGVWNEEISYTLILKEAIEEDSNEIENIKSELFANVSHEFKTPLNIILATMQLINNKIDTKKINLDNEVNLKKYMNTIKQNSYRLLRLVNNLIDKSKIQSGYYELDLGNHDIVNIVEDITLSIAPFVESKGINLVFDTDIEELIICCDPDKIERIMLNLLSNAVKYTENKGEIRVDLKSSEDKVTISIKDNGIGIPENELGYIFDRFRRVDNEYSKKVLGSGIGLTLVKLLVDMHGGEVHVKSKIGEGSEFSFELPKKVLKDDCNKKESKNLTSCRVEKCNIEFADIYNYVI